MIFAQTLLISCSCYNVICLLIVLVLLLFVECVDFMIELILMTCLVIAYDYVDFVGMKVGCKIGIYMGVF